MILAGHLCQGYTLQLLSFNKKILQSNNQLTNRWYVYSHSSSVPQCCGSSEQTFYRKKEI